VQQWSPTPKQQVIVNMHLHCGQCAEMPGSYGKPRARQSGLSLLFLTRTQVQTPERKCFLVVPEPRWICSLPPRQWRGQWQLSCRTGLNEETIIMLGPRKGALHYLTGNNKPGPCCNMHEESRNLPCGCNNTTGIA
jgi:hypothetical protein